jgi:cell division septum initiation protein DivIVA
MSPRSGARQVRSSQPDVIV